MDSKRFIASHVVDLPKSGIRDFFEIVAKMKNVISLGIGEPDFDTPWHIREAAIYALEKGKTHYTSNLGLIELRRAISRWYKDRYDVEIDPESEAIVTIGSKEGLAHLMLATLDHGDTVLVVVTGTSRGRRTRTRSRRCARRLRRRWTTGRSA